MCLAVPGKILTLFEDNTGMVDFMGVQKRVALDLIDTPQEGDYVIVHAGFAIKKLSEQDAQASLSLFEELYGRDDIPR